MLGYIEYLSISDKIASVIIGMFLIIQIVGAFLDFKGKAVPEAMNIYGYFKNRKKERETLESIPNTLKEVNVFLEEVKQHYNNDNIAKRNGWMKMVEDRFRADEMKLDRMNSKLDKTNEYVLALIVDDKRNYIIDFASRVMNSNYNFTREHFHRVFKVYGEYEKIIKENGMTNGEVDIAFRIIKEAYAERLKEHTFVEDIRGYNK